MSRGILPVITSPQRGQELAAARLWELQPYTVARALAEKAVAGITFTDVAGGIQIDIDSGVAAHATPRAGAALIWTMRDSLRGTPVNFETLAIGGFNGGLTHRLDAPTLPTGQEVDLLIGTCDATDIGRIVAGGIRAQTTPACVAWRSSASSPAINTEYLDGAPGAGLQRVLVDHARVAFGSTRAGTRWIEVVGDCTEDPKILESVGPSWTEGGINLGPYRYHVLAVRVETETTAPVSYVVRPLTICRDDSQ